MANTENWRHQVRNAASNRLPVERPPRIEMRVRQGHYDQHGALFEDDDNVVCNCFPRTSNFAIPSMFYDKIVCPHQRQAHIQPAQQEHFDYPWTPSSAMARRKPIEDDLSERLSLMSSEDEQLRFTPALIDRKPGDVMSIATAPPYWYEHETNPRTHDPPFTAPADYEIHPTGRVRQQRALSLRDLKDPTYRNDEFPRRAQTHQGQRNSRLSNRQFTGSYVDPKDGKVYKYNVNYDGTPQPKGTRQPLDKPITKPTEPIDKPITKPTEPIDKSITKPTGPIDQSITKSIDQASATPVRRLMSAQQ